MLLKHTAIYTRITTMVTAVAMMLKPPTGSNTAPSTRATTTANIDCAMVATYGVRCTGWVRPNALGKTSMRPIAYITRVAAFTPALALAIALFTMARKMMNHPTPQYLVAIVVQGSGFSAYDAILSKPQPITEA